LGRLPAGQCRLPVDVRQQGRHRCGIREGQARGEAAGREQPPVARDHGAPRRDRRVQRGRPAVHAVCDQPEPARRAHGDVAHLPHRGKSDPRRLSGRRRRLRAKVGLSGRCAGAVGGAPHRPPGEVGLHPVGKHAHRPSRPPDDLLWRARPRRARQDPGAACQVPLPARRLFRRRGACSRRVLAALHSGSLRHPDAAHHVAGTVHQHLAVRTLSRRRTTRGGLFHGAPDRARSAYDRNGPRRDQAPQPDPDGQASLRDADIVDVRQRRVRTPDGQVHRTQRREGISRAQESIGEARQAARPRGELLHRVRRHLQ
jgi:hypothetical protein